MKTSLTILFSLLYLAVGFVSVYHSISFFSISNSEWLAVILALAFEIGQAAVLFSLLTSKSNKTMPWILMGVLTAVQVLGNVYSSYHYSVLNSPDEIKYFTDSVLFFIQDPNPQVNQVMISYITGAILPIVALCMTSMIVDVSDVKKPEDPIEDKPKEIDGEIKNSVLI
jgi:hypothetical protein